MTTIIEHGDLFIVQATNLLFLRRLVLADVVLVVLDADVVSRLLTADAFLRRRQTLRVGDLELVSML